MAKVRGELTAAADCDDTDPEDDDEDEEPGPMALVRERLLMAVVFVAATGVAAACKNGDAPKLLLRPLAAPEPSENGGINGEAPLPLRDAVCMAAVKDGDNEVRPAGGPHGFWLGVWPCPCPCACAWVVGTVGGFLSRSRQPLLASAVAFDWASAGDPAWDPRPAAGLAPLEPLPAADDRSQT